MVVIYITRYWGLLSGWLSGKEASFNAGAERDMGSIPGVQEDPLEIPMTTHSSILA